MCIQVMQIMHMCNFKFKLEHDYHGTFCGLQLLCPYYFKLRRICVSFMSSVKHAYVSFESCKYSCKKVESSWENKKKLKQNKCDVMRHE